MLSPSLLDLVEWPRYTGIENLDHTDAGKSPRSLRGSSSLVSPVRVFTPSLSTGDRLGDTSVDDSVMGAGGCAAEAFVHLGAFKTSGDASVSLNKEGEKEFLKPLYFWNASAECMP